MSEPTKGWSDGLNQDEMIHAIAEDMARAKNLAKILEEGEKRGPITKKAKEEILRVLVENSLSVDETKSIFERILLHIDEGTNRQKAAEMLIKAAEIKKEGA